MTVIVRIFLIFNIIALVMTSCRTAPKSQTIPHVRTASIDQRDVPIYFDTIGQAIPPVTVNIRPQAAGKILEAYVEQGADVKKGENMYLIDPAPYQAALDQAKATLKKDEAILVYNESAVNRFRQVVEEDYISKLTFEQTVSNAESQRGLVEADKALVTAAEINLEYCSIKAPVDGKISYSNIDVGNIVVASDPNAITVLRPYLPIDINFSLSQDRFEEVRGVQGNEGKWRFVTILPQSPKMEFDGETYFIDNQIDQDTGTILLRGRLSNVDRPFWPGEFVRVRVLYRIAPQALVIPPGALLIGRDGPYVYVIDQDKKAKNINVQVLTKEEEYVAITSDQLKKGDVVVTEGQINIAPGMAVNVD